MGIVRGREHVESVHTLPIRFANVTFDHPRREALTTVLDWLEGYGLAREDDELEPTTDWDAKLAEAGPTGQSLVLAGRFGQWKYYWTDDCVLRGLAVKASLGG